jgi:PDZ domain-containing secreted protein
LRVGDVLDAVDGAAIKTPMDLAVELSNKPFGSKVKIGYVTRGYWQAETALILGKE